MENIIYTLFSTKKTWYDRAFFISILAIVFLVPLLFTFRLKSVFTLPKLYALAFFLVVALIMLAIKYFKDGSLLLRPGKFNLLIGTYSVLLILSAALSVNIYSSLFGAYGRFMGLFTLLAFLILAFLIFNFIREKSEQIIIFLSSYVSSIIIVAIGILQHMG